MSQAISEAQPLLNGQHAVSVAPAVPRRLYAIDLVRGVVIVLMALDHVKGHLVNVPFDLLDVTRTTPAYFVTRWVSHFCAPVFVFLAGTGAFLYGARGRTKGELAWFLVSRGLWLLVLELTVIRYVWLLNVDYEFAFGQVIWAIGWSMIVLAGLIYVPLWVTLTLGLAVIGLHNLFDGVQAEDCGPFGGLWCILHRPEMVEFFGRVTFFPMYPLIPWLAVLAVGYCFGALMLRDRSERRRQVFTLGLVLTVLFIALRYSNLYGDQVSGPAGAPGPWSVQRDWLFTIFSFINCHKYPPSLCFLLMTLGPALMFLAWCDREPGRLGRFFIVFGRVPLFFYLLHWYLIKSVTLGLAYLRFGRTEWFFGQGQPPEDYNYPLWSVYVMWAGVVLALFPLCYWFARVKARSRAVWLSYL